METLSELAATAWNYKLSLVPVLITYLLFDLPAIARRLTGIAYIPIYFIFFPSGHSDRLYAQYFNEDWFYGDGSSMTEDEKRSLRLRIQATAILSMVFATIVAPWLCGFIAAFYLTTTQFYEFLVFLVVVKAIILIWVLIRLRSDSAAAVKSFNLICTLYAIYLVLVVRGLTKSFEWTHGNFQSKGLGAVVWGLLDYAYVDFFINAIIVGAITWSITTLWTNPSNIPKSH